MPTAWCIESMKLSDRFVPKVARIEVARPESLEVAGGSISIHMHAVPRQFNN